MIHIIRIVNCKFKQVYSNKKLTKKQKEKLEEYISKEEQIKLARKDMAKKLQDYMKKIKEYVLNNLLNKQENYLVRNINDRKMDISILGSIIPFNMFNIDNEKDRIIIKSTIDKINNTLRSTDNGYYRFEQDHYMNNNPWVISSLWMALYYIKIKDIDNAKKCFKFAVDSATKLSFLPEQFNKEKDFKWVIGLGWSHAMFILVLDKLKEVL